MLHALIHRKLDESIPEPRRREDAVTSSVFGTLLLAGAAGLPRVWFDDSRDSSLSLADQDSIDGYWFWPRLRFAEPDLVLHIGDRLYVIEAKVLAGRHDAGPIEDVERPRDQLVREWISVAGPLGPGPAAPAGLAAALGSAKPALVYVVDHRRINSATRDFQESLSLVPPDSDLRLRTWQGLHRQIWSLAKSAGPWHWARHLLAYLDLVGLSGFTGFSTPAATAACRESLETWSRRASPGDLQLSVLAVLQGRSSIAALSIWGSSRYAAGAAPPRSLGLRASVHSVLTLGPAWVRGRIPFAHQRQTDSGDQHVPRSP